MDLTFKLELSSDPSTLDALTKYRALIDYLMNHPNVSDDEKLGLEFCQLNSNMFVCLQTYYRGFYKIKDLTALKTSRDYIQILIQNTVPNMTLEFFENDNKIMVMTDGLMQEERDSTKDQKEASNTNQNLEVQILEVKATSKQTVSDDDIESEYECKLVQAATESEQKATYQTPICQVNAGTTSVASLVTTRQSSARKSDKGSVIDRSALIGSKTVLVPTLVTPGHQTVQENAKESERGPMRNTMANMSAAAFPKNVSQPFLSQGGTLLEKGSFNLNTLQDTEETKVSSGINHPDKATDDSESYDFTGNEGEVLGKPSDESNDMTNNPQDSRSERLTDLSSFTPVEGGVKVYTMSNDKKVTTLSSENRNINSFAVLRDYNKENANDKATDSITEEETSTY